MLGLGNLSDSQRNRERRENARITRAQLRMQWARRRETLHQWCLRLTGNKPAPKP